jgi:hypothetical protein
MAINRSFLGVGTAIVLSVAGCAESAKPKIEASVEKRPTSSEAAVRVPTLEPPGREAPVASDTPRRPSGLPSSVKEVTFDDIKLDMKKEDPFVPEKLTDKVKSLDGTSIRVRGYILPSFQQEGIKQFVLVRDNLECCFGPGALLHDCILVEMQPPATATFTVRPVSVEGKFTIHPVKDPTSGRHLAIYHLDGKAVR